MIGENKRLVVSFSDQNPIKGSMTVEFAQERADILCPDHDATVEIQEVDKNTGEYILLAKRENGEWKYIID